MTEVIVNSDVCGFTHKIHGVLNGGNIVIDIDSPCEKIQRMGHLLVPILETLDIKDNYVIDRAQKENCSSNCLVPCAILNVCKIEAGFLARSLVKKAGGLSIEFKDA
ncbi:hypothetical protein HNV12_15040 [Methanococcoides sp. SA1]|nr:hypothetical protein [Methanococcoides sp. SA1]